MKQIQPTFAAGELSPGLHGRVDLARYLTALATCRNAITKASGGVEKRPGYYFRGEVKDSADAALLLPFVYSTEIRYIVECGDLHFRFLYLDDDGAAFPLLDGATRVELVTPYAAADLANIRITQSADVLYIACDGHPPRELRRLTPTSFELREHAFRNGPFRPINDNEALRAAVSAATGEVTVTVSEDMFTEGHVGALFYIEEPELRAIEPWEPAAKNIAAGSLRRSDGKVYRSVGNAGGGGATYHITGSVRPVHDSGRAWDGSRDIRNDGVSNYAVGVEWEFVHSGYGIVQLTGFNSATSMDGLVVSRVPDSCVGTVAPTMTWSDTGDGTTKVFPIVGATSTTNRDYSVSLDGAGVPFS